MRKRHFNHTLALAIICKGTDEEAMLLDRCLTNLRPYVDGVYVTQTQPNDMIANVVKAHGGHLSYYEWDDNFANARNFNFSRVAKGYHFVMWTDVDDMWRGIESLRETIDKNFNADGFGFWYLYDWDETRKPVVVHKKTMIVRNDGSFRWEGALHEDLTPLRAVDIRFVNKIERLHLSSKERAEENAKRNVHVATKDQAANPNDPRSYWNLGNSQLGVGDFAGARDTFEKFLKMSDSDDEKYIIHQRLADVYKALGVRDEAIKHLQIAIGLLPALPDAYLVLGFHYYSYGDLEKAEQYILQGLVRKPQTHKMIVFNPRDYDYNPMMLLAKIYYQKSRPDLMLPLLEGCLKIYPKDMHLRKLVKDGKKDKKILQNALLKLAGLQRIALRGKKWKLKQELDKLPASLKSHPAIAVLRNQNFIKEMSSGRDLTIYCGNTSHQWNPLLFQEKGFGGSEEAVIHLAKCLSDLGWNVTVYNNCGHKEVSVAGVTYRPFWEWNYRDKTDVTILWRWVKPLDAEINCPRIYVDLHDVIQPGEFTEKRIAKLAGVFVKSQFHRSLFPNLPDDKVFVIPNGFDAYQLHGRLQIKKEPFLMINTSSPDRSMDVLPALFKRVKERVPEARLQWAYGWDVFDKAHAADAKKMEWKAKIEADMKDAGIEVLGRLPQHLVAELYKKAVIYAYPSEFAEIDCISIKKAQACDCLPVTSDFGALGENNIFGYKVHSEKTKDTWAKPYQFSFGIEDPKAQDEWVDITVKILKGEIVPEPVPQRWKDDYRWPDIARKWHDIFYVKPHYEKPKRTKNASLH